MQDYRSECLREIAGDLLYDALAGTARQSHRADSDAPGRRPPATHICLYICFVPIFSQVSGSIAALVFPMERGRKTNPCCLVLWKLSRPYIVELDSRMVGFNAICAFRIS